MESLKVGNLIAVYYRTETIDFNGSVWKFRKKKDDLVRKITKITDKKVYFETLDSYNKQIKLLPRGVGLLRPSGWDVHSVSKELLVNDINNNWAVIITDWDSYEKLQDSFIVSSQLKLGE